ncbi:MAG TPA: response regulator [Nitrospiria bacterium]|nr:response regulator [Nitrospiria bacterium]
MSAPRLLVIDHDPEVQHAVETALGPEGFEVTAVGDGLSALDVALATTPDVVLAEYRMEGINVFRFLEKLKHKNSLKSVALLLLVSPGDVYDELTLRLVGVTDFLPKPLNPKETLERVKRYRPLPLSVPASSAIPKPTEQAPGKIEDLLGWSQAAAPSPFSELSQDHAIGMDFNLAGSDAPENAPESIEATEFLARNEITPSDHPVVANETEQAFAELQDGPLAPSVPVFEAPVEPLFGEAEPSSPTAVSPASEPPSQPGPARNGSSGPQPELVERLARNIARDAVEKVAWDVVPDLAKQSVERVITAVVERVVWDIVPAIAEAAVKQEIERLTRDNG